MVQTSVLQAIIIGIATISVGFFTVSTRIWMHTENLSDREDDERIQELQDYRKSELSSEVKNLYINIEEYLDDNPYDEGSPNDYEQHLVNIIDNEIDPDELNAIVEMSENINEASNLYERHESEYRTTYRYFAAAGAALLGLNGVVVSALIQGTQPFQGLAGTAQAILLFITILAGYRGGSHFTRARNIKEEFDNMWREYRYRY